jgi:RNA-directed DNA polymerase
MSLHQKLDGSTSGHDTTGRGEADSGPSSCDEARLARQGGDGSGQDLLLRVLARDNMIQAWKGFKKNGGSAGVDGRARPGENFTTM